MKLFQNLLSPFSLMVMALGVSILMAAPLQGQGRKKNPTSKLFVADVQGEAVIDTGETIDQLAKRTVYTAQGVVIETKEAAINAMVFSNGTGISLDPDTRVEVRKFVQEPFTPNRTDMEIEPSISQTVSHVSRGTVGVCTSKLVAGSSMQYTTPNGSVRIKGGKVAISADDTGTTVALLEGDVTVQAGEMDAGGQVLQPGFQAFIPNSGGPMQISRIDPQQLQALDEKVSAACMARKTVYFEAATRREDSRQAAGLDDITAFEGEGEPDEEIIAIPTTPPNVPIQFTVSPANLPST